MALTKRERERRTASPVIAKVYKNGKYHLRIEAGTNRCLYRYVIPGEDKIVCQFDLLCEVGAPYQPRFREIIRANNLTIETIEQEEWPWVFDRISKPKENTDGRVHSPGKP